MPLKTIVKVSNISNLSDARYCSGMGVDMLGFCVIPGRPNYIAPQLYQQIRGWIPGPKIVAEIYGLRSAEDLTDIINHYAPDYFEMDENEYNQYKDYLSIPGLVSVSGSTASQFRNFSGIAYLIIQSYEDLSSLEAINQATLLRTNSKTDLIEKLNRHQLAGAVLNSSPETNANTNAFDALADILEMLDEY